MLDGQLETVAIRIDVDAQLTSLEESRIELLRQRRAEFDATWRRDRGPKSKFPFPSGCNTDSHYEGSIAFFLRGAGWNPQAIMNAIAAWNRLHGIQIPAYASRYGATISKAFTLAKLYSEEPAPAKTKGCWAWGKTRARVLAAIQSGPRRPKEIIDELGVSPATVYMALGGLVEDGIALHVGHQYLAALLPVEYEVELPTPEDANVDPDYLEASYKAWISAGGLEAVEEEIEAPEMYSQPPVALHKAIPSDFEPTGFVDDNGLVHRSEHCLTVVPAEDPYEFTWPVGAVEEVYPALEEITSADKAQWRRENAAREIRYKQESLDNARKARARGNGHAQLKRFVAAKKRARWAKLPAGPLDPNGDRLEELEAERARLRHLDDKEDPA